MLEDAQDLVQRSLVTVNGNTSLPCLAEELPKTAFSKVRGDDSRSVLHIYNVNASGENANGRRQAIARRFFSNLIVAKFEKIFVIGLLPQPCSVVPFRRDHMETCIQSTLATRASKPIDFTAQKVVFPDIDDADVYLG